MIRPSHIIPPTVVAVMVSVLAAGGPSAAQETGNNQIVSVLAASGPSAAQEAGDNQMGLGTEGRNWSTGQLPDPTSPERFAVETEEHVKIPMRDGVRLDALVYHPDVDETPACILIADGYGWSYDPRDLRFAERGYAVVNVSMRGVNESEGEAGLYNEMARDGYDVVEWMADQPWCNGNVGAFGSSLPGIPLWQIAREQPPHLKAIAPDVSCGNCYEYLWYPGGMLPGPGRVSRGDDEYLAAIQHRNFDDWWRDRSVSGDDFKTLADGHVAIMVTGGFEDYITPGNIAAYEELTAAGGEARLMVSPGAHFDARTSVLGPYHHEQHMDLFFDHYLRGEDNEWVDGTYQGDALIWVNGPDRYRWEKTWPIPDTRQVRMQLREPESGSINSLNDGSLLATPPSSDEADVSYSYDPVTGPFLRTMRQSSQGTTKVDQQPFESEALTWTTDALAVPTEVTGKIEMDFWASADTADTDFVMMVSDVAPDGTSRYVTSGYLNAPRNESRSEPNPLVPGEVRKYHIENQPNAWVFQAGHRIRISVAGGTTPASDQTPSRSQGPGKNPNPANVTIYQDAERPSSVLFPIIGTAQLPSESYDGLHMLVDELVDLGQIRHGRDKQLRASIDRIAGAPSDSARTALSKAFQRQVDGFTPRFIDPEAASRLIAVAQRLEHS